MATITMTTTTAATAPPTIGLRNHHQQQQRHHQHSQKQQNHHHHYAFDAAKLLTTCIEHLLDIINDNGNGDDKASLNTLLDMKSTLLETQRLLHDFFIYILQTEYNNGGQQQQMLQQTSFTDVMKTLEAAIEKQQRQNKRDFYHRHITRQQQQQQNQGTRINTAAGGSFINNNTNGNANSSANNTSFKNGFNYSTNTTTTRSATDTLLFRLIVALQLCLVRIDDARLVIVGRRRKNNTSGTGATAAIDTNTLAIVGTGATSLLLGTAAAAAFVYMGTTDKQRSFWGGTGSRSNSFSFFSNQKTNFTTTITNRSFTNNSIFISSVKIAFTFIIAKMVRNKYYILWMTSKINDSISSIKEWHRQWLLVQSTTTRTPPSTTTSSMTMSNSPMNYHQQQQQQQALNSAAATAAAAINAEKSKLLLDFAHRQIPQSSFWYSQGELRFLMVKKVMDVFYAVQPSSWQLPPESFYTLHPAAATTVDNNNNNNNNLNNNNNNNNNIAETSPSNNVNGNNHMPSLNDLIRNSWSMVSTPSLKNLSLVSSKILKGAAIADRIEIAGVPCFILSREPCPELAVAINKFHNKKKFRGTISRQQLSTIQEGDEHHHCLGGDSEASSNYEMVQQQQQESTTNINTNNNNNKLAFGVSSNRSNKIRQDKCIQRDIILHITGGGFFAHMIAFDLPFLIDWSESANAVIICPEFALLPEHTYPTALNQVTDIFCALKYGDTIHTLGFEADRIIVTGESTGANLAVALCVNLCVNAKSYSNNKNNNNNSNDSNNDAEDDDDDECCDSDESLAGSSESEQDYEIVEWSKAHKLRSTLRLPDALMLSCAVLDLSLELSHSRVVGTEDPVLPSGVFSTISDAYIPSKLGISKRNMLVSPFYAPDKVLRHFPPTLLFASSNDPLLDDSVAFNQRLRSLGIESELRAVQNLPHAYWGLGTAGFPEAKKVQQECCEWLANHIKK